MKEFYLVPSNEFVKSCELNKVSEDKEKLEVLQNKNLTNESILSLFDSLINKKQDKTIKKDKEVEKMEIDKTAVKKEEENEYKIFAKLLPSKLHELALELIDVISKIPNVTIDKQGLMTFENEKSYRIEDVLKTFLVKNVGIQRFKKLLRAFLPHIEEKFIINPRLHTLFSNVDNSFEDSVTPKVSTIRGSGKPIKLFTSKEPYPCWIKY